ncbi:transposase family protein [Carbonactinospora thermoautotrophica]|uniref:transposase family protein n=1 Tax=Carbonactinospora thermoautotrophica TaxID=1469144 RepID=UPI003DA7F2A2
MSVPELLAVWFPRLARVRIGGVFLAGRSVRSRARTPGPEAVCPGCGAASRWVHGRAERRLSDTAIAGRETVIRLGVRRFCRRDDECQKKTFAEQVPGPTVRSG